MRYRKKPVEIEAVPATMFVDAWQSPEKLSVLPAWGRSALEQGGVMVEKRLGAPVPLVVVRTLEGDHYASHDDMIIQGVKGELYPCKPDIFAMTYEPVEEN